MEEVRCEAVFPGDSTLMLMIGHYSRTLKPNNNPLEEP
jgi:hypothetical protein